MCHGFRLGFFFFFLFPGAQKQLIPIWQIDESSDEGMFIVQQLAVCYYAHVMTLIYEDGHHLDLVKDCPVQAAYFVHVERIGDVTEI